MYPVRLTRLARAMATAKYSLEAVEQRAREELDGLGIDDPTAIFMHCFRMPNGKDYEFICTPFEAEDGRGIEIDTVSFEKGDVLTKGPLEGKRVSFPVPDSADRDD